MNCCGNIEHENIKAELLDNESFSKKVNLTAEIFNLIGEPNRMRIVLALSKGELCVYHLCEITGGKQSATSQHLRKLKDANLIKSRKEGNLVLYSLADSHVAEIIRLMITHLDCKK